jgi:ATP-dependent RNA helicase DDX52/ROK1
MIFQIATIYQECSNPKIKRALFSATLSNGIEEWARVHLDNVVRITIGVRFVKHLYSSEMQQS